MPPRFGGCPMGRTAEHITRVIRALAIASVIVIGALPAHYALAQYGYPPPPGYGTSQPYPPPAPANSYPATPPPCTATTGGAVRGAGRGAALGAVGGAIGGNAGK